MKKLHLYLIIGLSGAGKSHALQAFEDLGFYCVDNFPQELVESVTEVSREQQYDHVAMALDMRGGETVHEIPGIVNRLRDANVTLKIIYLEASNETLLNRYMESRRPHPLGESRSLGEAIEYERDQLRPARDLADVVIDTSDINIHQFRGILTDLYETDPSERFTLYLTSFGFKHGMPGHMDVLFDSRFLPNPHYEPALREQTGLDDDVVDFMEDNSQVKQFLQKINEMLEMIIGAYYPEGRRMISVAIGCTGGQHRSVYLVDSVAQHFKQRDDCKVIVTHRDMETVKVH